MILLLLPGDPIILTSSFSRNLSWSVSRTFITDLTRIWTINFKLMKIGDDSTRADHGSVRFEPQKPTEPSDSNFLKFKLNRTEFRFKSNRFGSVKFGFFTLKPGNLIT